MPAQTGSQQQQPQTRSSWTSWILDSYASSVSPYDLEPQTEDPAPQHPPGSESPISISHHLPSPPSSSSSSPYGPYTKSGRGGAGNFIWQHSDPSDGGDLESQTVGVRGHRRQSSLTERQKAAELAEHLETADAVVQSQNQRRNNKKPEMIRIGIGGAGNFALSQGPELQSPRISPGLMTSPSPSRTGFAGAYGRGGAGNQAAAVAAAEMEKNGAGATVRRSQQEEEDDEERKRREKVEAEVDQLLKMPEGVWVREGREKEE